MAYGKDYKVQVSSNGTTWQDVKAVVGSDGARDNLRFTPVTARYVRIAGTARGTTYGYSLFELAIYAQ